jgi:hypothetical protein
MSRRKTVVIGPVNDAYSSFAWFVECPGMCDGLARTRLLAPLLNSSASGGGGRGGRRSDAGD